MWLNQIYLCSIQKLQRKGWHGLNETTSEHYCVSIDEGNVGMETEYVVDFKNLSDKERYAAILKLHR